MSTPIGNLGDVTRRAIEVLGAVDLVLCEDTRHSRPLLDALGVRASVASHHAHNEAREVPRIVVRLLAGQSVALISDAGTPLLSDPGARLVRAAIAAGVPVAPVPGASALLAAVVASGLVDGPFTFLGFLARQGKHRRSALAEVSAIAHPAVLYEAGNRVGVTLADLVDACGPDRPGAVCRELTKRHEEFRRGTLAELASYYRESPPRGEVVIVVGAAVLSREVDTGAARTLARQMKDEGCSVRDVVHALREQLGVARNAAYAIANEDAHGEERSDG